MGPLTLSRVQAAACELDTQSLTICLREETMRALPVTTAEQQRLHQAGPSSLAPAPLLLLEQQSLSLPCMRRLRSTWTLQSEAQSLIHRSCEEECDHPLPRCPPSLPEQQHRRWVGSCTITASTRLLQPTNHPLGYVKTLTPVREEKAAKPGAQPGYLPLQSHSWPQQNCRSFKVPLTQSSLILCC